MENEELEEDNGLELNDRQELFCQEYIIDFKPMRAAIAAGYSKNSAHVIASHNLDKPHIIARIDELKADIFKAVGITQAKVYRELARLAMYDIQDAFNEEGQLLSVKKMGKGIAAAVTSVKGSGIDLEVRFADKQNALAQIVKIAGWNAPEKVNINANLSDRPINFE